MNLYKACVALVVGLKFCLGVPAIRALAFWPWVVGLATYLASIVTAFYLHPIILSKLVDTPLGWWETAIYGLAWVGVAILLLVATLVGSIVIVLVFTSVFQTAIATRVLIELGEDVPAEASGLKGLVKEIARSIAVESLKLTWLIPLFVVLFLVGLIPLLTPFAILLGAWLLAFQFVDITLDLYRLKASERFRFCVKHALPLTAFGLTLSFIWAIPFLGWIIPPVACAGASWFMSSSKLLPNKTS